MRTAARQSDFEFLLEVPSNIGDVPTIGGVADVCNRLIGDLPDEGCAIFLFMIVFTCFLDTHKGELPPDLPPPRVLHIVMWPIALRPT